MNKNDLIANQQLEIEILKRRLQWTKKDKDKISMLIICIGGPLNDNIMQYSKKQRVVFHKILELAEMSDHELIEERDET